jgi:phosphoribosylanthranilate isomerase
MTRIKICGFTREADARAAGDLGVDAIGLVFWPSSPRCLPLADAGRIVAALPPFVTAVGVFVNQPLDEIEHTIKAVGLGAVQLHGDEPEDVWTRPSVPVLKAVGVDAAFDARRLAAWPSRVVPLLDAAAPDRRGGTGRRIDWAVAAAAAAVRPIVLAGGLTPETVGEAIAAVRPAAVDVSSGVEDAPGVKDARKMAAFVAAVRQRDGQGR